MTSVTAEQPTTEQPTTRRRAARAAPRAPRRSFGGFLGQLMRDSGYLLLSLPMGILTFTVAVAGWSTAIGSLLTFIGVPVAVLTIAAMRGLSRVERRRAAVVLREPVPEHYTVRLPFQREDWTLAARDLDLVQGPLPGPPDVPRPRLRRCCCCRSASSRSRS